MDFMGFFFCKIALYIAAEQSHGLFYLSHTGVAFNWLLLSSSSSFFVNLRDETCDYAHSNCDCAFEIKVLCNLNAFCNNLLFILHVHVSTGFWNFSALLLSHWYFCVSLFSVQRLTCITRHQKIGRWSVMRKEICKEKNRKNLLLVFCVFIFVYLFFSYFVFFVYE